MFEKANRYVREQRYTEALALYQAILQLDSCHQDSLYNAGQACSKLGDFAGAAAMLERFLAISPEDAPARICLGQSLARLGNVAAAQLQYEEALRIDSEYNYAYEAFIALADEYNNRMDFPAAQRCNDMIIQRQLDVRYWQPRLLSMHYNPAISPDYLFREHLRWARTVEEAVLPATHSLMGRKQHTKLRIGYVSADFCAHPVACFIAAVWKNHNKREYQIYGYSNAKQPDQITEALKSHVDIWRDFRGLPDNDLFSMIVEDEIDILVDLAGHTEDNRLCVFARKPAPVQVTWLGYPNTTGLSRMDYRITDGVADPVGITDRYYTEELFRLPGPFLCYSPINDAPLAEPPVGRNDYITFGSFNKLKKITPAAIALWAKVLQATPGSRLLMKSIYLDEADVRRRISAIFTEYGVEAERVIFMEYLVSHARHLAMFNEVDIVLDPLRYSGTTSTCEALWMGVPVVTLAGEMHVSRVSSSLLVHAGLGGLIAATDEQYVRIARDLARNAPLLQQLKRTLRDRLRASPVMDGARFTAQLENAYRLMWTRWLAGNG